MPDTPEQASEEFAAFAIRYQPVLLPIARTLSGGRASDCDDLVQDVLLRVLLRWDRLKTWAEPARRAWMVRVLRNCFLDRCRRQGAESERIIDLTNVHQLFVDPEAGEFELWEFITEDELREAVSELQDNQRKAFELRCQGLRHAEIGRRLGAPVGTVGTWLFHARQGLREKLRERAEARRQQRKR
ncbi:RNA polymerase subunit sigma [Corallococcus sp. H22C18031201]|uniref:RNA polymerase sigma factor n=1 Tax=Citreicoccus inhibens TaxID=2849499 RepID=UPI000E71F762|nr:RNA polymerase sigma factor [Citreicoccus inhibens]MBU8897556.1 RNA polymerase sigma factor [Citreicoccus inhibens]RJS19241.1 RNA polymerase subunit sigma [Corallococcus sp. H22C18031201]